jgi:demethylmenaquinone methyltransferase/2-methoxy-6-polyprenyl-1,4-benzoquinol methylase
MPDPAQRSFCADVNTVGRLPATVSPDWPPGYNGFMSDSSITTRQDYARDDLPPSHTDEWDRVALTAPHTVPDKAARVRRMFDAIAPTYEWVNRVASVGRDAYWRRRAVRLAGIRSDDRVLDLACGTGDFARAFQAAGPERVVGADFAANMLRQALSRSADGMTWCQADALQLPFADETFTVAGCAFGVRNFQHLAAGLAEAHRVLKPGGQVVILEFGMPRTGVLRLAYRFYFENILPRLGTWISRDRTGAYRYLPQSVITFLDTDGMALALTEAGFASIRAHPMTFGIAVVYLAVKPTAGQAPSSGRVR